MLRTVALMPPPNVEVLVVLTLSTPAMVVEPFVVSTVRTEEEAAFKMLKAFVEFTYDCEVARVEVP